MEPTVKEPITYYKHGPQAGYECWFETIAGTYFIDTNGIVANVDGKKLKTSKVAK